MTDMASRRASWWRWPLVPLASILLAAFAAIVVTTFAELATGFYAGYSTSGWFHIYIYPLPPCAAFGYLLAATAHAVAPAAKRRASMVMVAIMSLVLAGFVSFVWTIAPAQADAMQTTSGSVAAIAAALLALWQAESETSQRD